MGLLLYLLILAGFVLEIKSDYNLLPTEQYLPSIIDELKAENGILSPTQLSSKIRDFSDAINYRSFSYLQGNAIEFSQSIIDPYNRLIISDRLAVEEKLIAYQLVNDIIATDINIRTETKNKQVSFQEKLNYLNKTYIQLDILYKYVLHMLEQHENAPSPQLELTIQLKTSNGNSKKLKFPTVEHTLEKRRMDLQELSEQVEDLYIKLQDEEKRNQLEINRTNRLIGNINAALFYARTEITEINNTKESVFKKRLKIVQVIELHYQILKSHMENMINQYKNLNIEILEIELRNFIREVEEAYISLIHRNIPKKDFNNVLADLAYISLEYLYRPAKKDFDDKVAGLAYVHSGLIDAINEIENNNLPEDLRLQKIEKIRNRYLELNSKIQPVLMKYGQRQSKKPGTSSKIYTQEILEDEL